MADIDIERKSSSIWPWMIGLVALLAVVLVWAVADREPAQQSMEARRAAEMPVGTSGSGSGGGAIDDYVAFAGLTSGDQRGEMGRDHEYTAEGIRKLSGALQAIVERQRNADANVRFERFREVADRIQQDPTSSAHAAQVRDAFTRAADVMESVNAPSATQLQQTATSIDRDQPLLEQREKVHSFFRQSAEAIQTLARR